MQLHSHSSRVVGSVENERVGRRVFGRFHKINLNQTDVPTLKSASASAVCTRECECNCTLGSVAKTAFWYQKTFLNVWDQLIKHPTNVKFLVTCTVHFGKESRKLLALRSVEEINKYQYSGPSHC